MQSETGKSYVFKLLNQALEKLGFNLPEPTVNVPESGFGDYSSNAGLVLAKKLKVKPKEVAEKIIAEIKQLDADTGNLEDVTEKSGFINFRLSQKFLINHLQKIIDQRDLYGASAEGQGKTVVFEYSSPNTNKPLHIGHTRNDVYGMACINLLKATGHKVVACEIINDRGIHIMKSLLMYLKFGQGKTPESEKVKSDHFVGKFYQMFAQKAAEGEEQEKQLLEEAQELLQKWEAGDTEVRKLWKQMNEWFFAGVKETYEKEGSYFDEVDYESEIYDQGREIVLEGVKKGAFKREHDGSVSVDLADHGLDKKYLLRKDGTTLYVTQDLYLWHLRNERHHPDVAIVTTSAEQSYHFRVLKKLFELLEYPWAQTFRHLPYEHVFLGHDKMSSREDKTITADDLLTMVKEKVIKAMAGLEKIKQTSANEKLVEQVAFGAIKYGYLKYEPNTRIYFDPDQTIALNGNTGPYIQYAYSRIQSILKKAGQDGKMKIGSIQTVSELALARELLHFSEKISLAANEYKPNLLANYLYQLASAFNAFYSEVPVLKEADEGKKSFRLKLITATAQVIKNGLYLLGIEAPEEM